MGSSGFNRQWSRHAEQVWNNHRAGWHGGWDGGPPWHGRGRSGPPPWVAGLFGLATGEQQRGPRVRRGDVRSAILDVLAGDIDSSDGQSLNGYQVITQIAERSRGGWKPSPGSVYPTISQLEDEGLVEADETAGRRTLRLSEAGWEYVTAHQEELARVWEPFTEESSSRRESPDYAQLKPELGQMMGAVWQIVTQGSDQQRAEAIDVLVETRRKLYGILADGPDGAAS